MTFVLAIGYAAVVFVLYKAFRIVWALVYPFVIGRKKNLRELAGANWAVVTGATDGIGRSFAFKLASQGFDLILVSLVQTKLYNTSIEINKKYPNVNVKTIQFDFTVGDSKAYEEQLLSKLDGYEIGCLVNNVGMATDYLCRLDEIPGGLDEINQMVTINTLPLTVLSAYVLKQMVKRKRGLIINISSTAGSIPMPFFNVYSAAKQYTNWLSEILRKEYGKYGITVQTLTPSWVATKLSDNFISEKQKKTSFVPTPDEYVASAVRTIGLAPQTTGYIHHQLKNELVLKLMPSCILDKELAKFAVVVKNRAANKKAQ